MTFEQRKNYTHEEDIAGGREAQWGHKNSSTMDLGNSMFGTFKGALSPEQHLTKTIPRKSATHCSKSEKGSVAMAQPVTVCLASLRTQVQAPGTYSNIRCVSH